jgi:hypothetical protein
MLARSLTLILPVLASVTAASPPKDVGGFVIDAIGGLMGMSGPLLDSLGGPTVDIRETLCKTFQSSNFLGTMIGNIFGNPNGPTKSEICEKDDSGGSGPYKAKYLEDPSLPAHTIYVPINPPTEKMPILVWANGFCLPAGTV